MGKTRVLELAAVLIAGCSIQGSADGRWHGDVAFDPAQRAAIETGARFIAEHVGVRPIVIVWDGPREGDMNIIRAIPHPTKPGELGQFVSGTVFAPARITIRPDNVDPAVAAHEFGHWLGLDHTLQGLMSATDPILEWTEWDRAMCRAKHAGTCP